MYMCILCKTRVLYVYIGHIFAAAFDSGDGIGSVQVGTYIARDRIQYIVVSDNNLMEIEVNAVAG